jgi:hypothetical protein
MGGARQSVSDAPAGHEGRQGGRPGGRRWPGVLFSAFSGVLALMIGAAVSLVTSGGARVVVWCAVSGSVAVAAGVAYEMLPLSACQETCRRWLRWPDA